MQWEQNPWQLHQLTTSGWVPRISRKLNMVLLFPSISYECGMINACKTISSSLLWLAVLFRWPACFRFLSLSSLPNSVSSLVDSHGLQHLKIFFFAELSHMPQQLAAGEQSQQPYKSSAVCIASIPVALSVMLSWCVCHWDHHSH